VNKPVAIFRHSATEGPAFFAEYLDAQQIPWQLMAFDEGAVVPQCAEDFAGLVFMGGPMSVNDDLPWIEPVLQLICQAVDKDIPVLGHCLGSQLMCRALGGQVMRNSVKEIGWGAVTIAQTPIARHWFGSTERFDAFHWHGETWSLPADAQLIAGSEVCAHQAFALGPHLGMQFHIEMTEPVIRRWCYDGAAEIAANSVPSVQSAPTIVENIPHKLPALNQMAVQVYKTWVTGLRV